MQIPDSFLKNPTGHFSLHSLPTFSCPFGQPSGVISTQIPASFLKKPSLHLSTQSLPTLSCPFGQPSGSITLSTQMPLASLT